jgi:filamentous hemagglutinin family protein
MSQHFPQAARGPFTLGPLATSLLLCFAASSHAAPQGGTVAAGSASIANAGAVTTITQGSANAVLNWQSFGIGAGETVQFRQPGPGSVALNRVVGGNPSAILGSLTANGQVFLVNPNGILFGQGASVNVGGLVASTLNISDADFMASRYSFNGASGASVANQGAIHAADGYVALLGARVENTGTLTAPGGSVALAAGSAGTLDVLGGKLLAVAVDQGAVDALAHNGGLIQADGGQVLLTAQAARGLLTAAVNNTGVVQARTLGMRNGTIQLLGDMQVGTVSIGGTLDVSGSHAGERAGQVTATAAQVGLFGARIDASAPAGGGTVLIGGGWQGSDPRVGHAKATYMSADSTINADATGSGQGGEVVLWSDGSTRARGTVSARGGAQGGDGGRVETSGHWLDVAGIEVTASAANGARGTWLLDPADVTIGAGTTNGAFIANVFTPDSGVDAATVDVGALRTALEAGGGTNVTITTVNTGAGGNGAGDINVKSALTWTPTTAATLTLSAARDVNINADITTTRGNLVVCCGRDVNVRAAITTTNGSVLLSAGRNVNLARVAVDPLTSFSRSNVAGITTTDGNIAMCAAQDINLSNTFDGAALMTLTRGSSTGGLDLANLGVPLGLLLSAGTGGTGPGPGGGTVNFTAGTFVTVTGPNAPVTVHYNPVSYTAPTNYTGNFTAGAALTQRMLVFAAGGDKTFDGSTATTLTGLKGAPAGVTLVAGPASVANFDSAAVGAGKVIGFSGYSLAGAAADSFALPVACCGPIVARTTGSIAAAAPAPAPLPPLPVVVVPVVPVPVPVVIAPPALIIPAPVVAPTTVVAAPVSSVAAPNSVVDATDEVSPQFAPFVVAPILLRTPTPLLVVAPTERAAQDLVVVQAAAPAPAVAPMPAPAPAYVAPVLPPKPFRN